MRRWDRGLGCWGVGGKGRRKDSTVQERRHATALFFCYQIFWEFFLLPAYFLCCRLVKNPATMGFSRYPSEMVTVCVCVHEWVTPNKAPFSPSPPQK